jgi:hypothetical protein
LIAVQYEQRSRKSAKAMLEILNIKREVETLSQRLDQAQDYL